MKVHLPPPINLLIAAGGSGGHLFPAQKIALSLKEQNVGIWFAGAGLDKSPFFDRKAFEYCDIDSPPLTLSPQKYLETAVRLCKGGRRANSFLKDKRFDAILGFGSFHTLTVLAAGVWNRIPLMLHEANAKPGKAISLFAPFASSIAVQFQNLLTKWKKAVLTQMPVASSTPGDRFCKRSALSHFSFDSDRPILLITGGSQGSAFLNKYVPRALHRLSHRHLQILHLAGQNADCCAIQQYYADAGFTARVLPFESQIERAWSIAQAVISRAGSSTLAEIQHFCTPALLIPYPGAGQHQVDNAQQMVQQSQGAIVMAQNDANCERLANQIEDLFNPNCSLLGQMRSALYSAKGQVQPQQLSAWVYAQLVKEMR